MSITVTDPLLLEQLKAAADYDEIRGPDGVVLMQLRRLRGVLPAGYQPPISGAEIEHRRKTETEGQTLDEVWKDILSQHG